jgi:hypothetical protein
MIITQAYKYTENNAVLYFAESSKVLLNNDTAELMQGALTDVICEVQGDYTTMYEAAEAADRISYLQSEYDMYGDTAALQKITDINNLIDQL